MKKQDFLEAMGDINDSYISGAHEYKPKSTAQKYVKWLALAACLVIAVGAYALVRGSQGSLPVDNNPPVTEQTTDSPEVTLPTTSSEEATTAEPPAEADNTTTSPTAETEPATTTELPVEQEEAVEVEEEIEVPVEEDLPPVESSKWPDLPNSDDPAVAGLIEADVHWAGENPGSGEPLNYDHYMTEMFEIMDNLQLLSYEITRVYTPEEAVEAAPDEVAEYYTRSSGLYDIHVYYDHIAQQEVDYTIRLTHAGNEAFQWAGIPSFGVGEKFMSAIYYSEQFEAMIPAMEFYLDGENAYYIATSPYLCCPVDGSIPDLDLPMAEDEWWRITTTKNNPMIFHRKLSAKALSEYIRTDWNWRINGGDKPYDWEYGIIEINRYEPMAEEAVEVEQET